MFKIDRLSWRGFDWLLLAAIFLLCAIGFAAIYSVDLSHGSLLVYTKKHFIAFSLGIFLLFFTGFTAPTFFKNYTKWFYFLSLILLVAVLIFGRNVRGTTGWFSIANFSLQPVEYAKVALILMLAYVASNFGRQFQKPLFFFGTGIIALLPIILTLFQPDLGSAILLGLIWFGMMWVVGARKMFLFFLTLALILASFFSWTYLFAPYQKERIYTFLDPTRDPLGSGHNVIQSVIAVGSGGIFGRGLGFGSQSQLRFLPETQTDFIFSVIGEELGLAGVLVVLALFMIIFYRLYRLAIVAQDDFSAYATMGLSLLIFSQFFINIGANIGILPVTGVTLPFVSYGGSSLTANMILVGVITSLNKRYNSL